MLSRGVTGCRTGAGGAGPPCLHRSGRLGPCPGRHQALLPEPELLTCHMSHIGVMPAWRDGRQSVGALVVAFGAKHSPTALCDVHPGQLSKERAS